LFAKSTGILAVLLGCLFGATHSPLSCHAQNSKIPPDLIQTLFDDIQTDSFRLSEEDRKIIRDNLKLRRQDVNRDGMPEIFLVVNHHYWCGASGNCKGWIYQKQKSRYRLLLEDHSLVVTNRFTKGYRDIQSRMHGGMCSREEWQTDVVTYKYNGKAYRLFGDETLCTNINSGKLRVLRER
jgi:hypothetical protein